MKKLLLNWMTIMVVAIMCFCYVSCKEDEGPKEDGLEKTENLSNQDPEGTMVLNMISGSKDNYYDIGFGESYKIHIDEAMNFIGASSTGWSQYGGSYTIYPIEFVTVGTISGLGKITSIPTSGWAKSVAVVPGTGYIARYNSQYSRIYVVDYLGQTSTDALGNTYGTTNGATIKYQTPFQLPIKLSASSLSFNSGAESQTLQLENPTTVTIEKKPEWCGVSCGETYITVSVSENLTAEQRQGEIMLKNSSNSLTINVTQKGSSSPSFQSGSGTTNDPYQISNAQQLKNISKARSAHFILTKDIVLNEEANGSGWDPVCKQETPFTGTLNGQKHTIKNLWVKRPTTNYVGLFGYINDAKITNVRLEIGSNGMNGGTYVGGICGYATGNSEIKQCSVKGSITGQEYVGGICGYADAYYSYAMYRCIFSECYSEGTIESNGYVGGITGFCYNPDNAVSSISNCYSISSLSSTNTCCGISMNGSHSKCYYAGIVNNGYFYCNGSYTYFDNSIIGTTSFGSSSSANARTTAQMKTQSNYEGWDFSNTWKITEGMTYPTLRCFD